MVISLLLIAEDRLTSEAQAAIHDLLGKDVNISDAEIASWANNLRREKRSTGPWHYVDVPTSQPSFDEDRDGERGNSVIDKLTEFEKVLEDKSKSKDERAEALKCVVHFAGDIEQPLHCAERDGDRGGNKRLVYLLDRPKAVNLHQVWDSQILILHKARTRNANYADTLNGKITDKQSAETSKGTPTDWANESHKLAVDVAYRDVPADGPPPKLDEKYVDRAGDVIDEQLQRGGIRLATILNRVFAGR